MNGPKPEYIAVPLTRDQIRAIVLVLRSAEVHGAQEPPVALRDAWDKLRKVLRPTLAIPSRAFEAAEIAIEGLSSDTCISERIATSEAAVSAAAPLIVAAELRRLADESSTYRTTYMTPTSMRERADELDPSSSELHPR